MPTHDYDEDIDDIMASIQQRHYGAAPPPLPAEPEPKSQPKKISSDSTLHRQQQSVLQQAPVQHRPAKKAKKPWKLKKPVKIMLFLVLFVIMLAVPAYFYQDKIKATVSDLLAPPSPFKQQLVEEAGFPLYYPTKLPGTFKMETDNISSNDSVVLFVITDNDGKRINITLQKKPSGLNLTPLNDLLTDKGVLDTKFGKVMIGTSKEDMELVNIATDKTWIIVSSPKDTLDDSQFVELINSLKAVNPSEED